jgi:hypothetical protein
MTKYTEVECDGCGARQTNIIDNMEYTFVELVRSAPNYPKKILRHLCPDCTIAVYDFVGKRRESLNPEKTENRVSTIR